MAAAVRGEALQRHAAERPDFAKLAEAYGVRGITVETVDEAERAIDEAWTRRACS